MISSNCDGVAISRFAHVREPALRFSLQRYQTSPPIKSAETVRPTTR